MNLTLQDKLALALTTAGSMRNLAALVGVSHQKIGRWLREGQETGRVLKSGLPQRFGAIPDDVASIRAIDQAFDIHAEIAYQQAAIDHIPFNPDAPVYMHRKPLRSGKPGDRIFATNTDFIARDLRGKIIADMSSTNKIYAGSVRSTVSLHRYMNDRAREELAARPNRRLSVPELAEYMLASFVERERIEKNRIIDPTETMPLFTKLEPMLRARGPINAARNIEKKLRQKHEPATQGIPKTRLASEFLFQLTPPGYVEPSRRVVRKKAPAKRAKRVSHGAGKGRGPK